MKRAFYIVCFGFLGVLVQFLAHAVIEMLVLRHIDWTAWHPFWHAAVGVPLFAAGLVLGLWQGIYWWEELYVKKNYGKVK